jgi:hypothetical protein
MWFNKSFFLSWFSFSLSPSLFCTWDHTQGLVQLGKYLTTELHPLPQTNVSKVNTHVNNIQIKKENTAYS